MNVIPKIPPPSNEPVLSYAPSTPERVELKQALKDLSTRQADIPLVIGGKDVRTGTTVDVVMPHCHRHVLARVQQAGPGEVEAAIAAARDAWRDWSAWRFERRAAVFLKAADLLATRYRPIINAATMLGQSKTAHQAEIDAACELIDFFRFNVHFAERVYAEQPLSAPGTWNYLDHRPLEGFIYAITPFNFTSIGGNLPTAPAIMGNTVVWKPAATAVLSNYFILRLLEEAGLPPGVINFIPGPSARVSERVLADRAFAGIHFTGSTEVFHALWKQAAANLTSYASYPRLVGETGGKDFILAHASADVDALATGMVRGAFEYQGQKCSAASRAYVPASLWPRLRDRMLEMLAKRVGVRTIGDLAALPDPLLGELFGQYGRLLGAHARGIDLSPVMPPGDPKSISREITFDRDQQDVGKVRETALGLLQDVGRSLRVHALSARTVVLKIRYQPFDTQSRQATLPFPTDRDDQLAEALRHLFETQVDRHRPIRLIGAGVSNLEPCATQLSLLETRSSRLANLDERLDDLRARYGDHVIARGAAGPAHQKDVRRDDLDTLRESG